MRPWWKGPKDPLLRYASLGLMLLGVVQIWVGLLLITRG